MFFACEGFDDADAGERFLHGHRHLSHSFLLVLDRATRALTEDTNGEEAGWEEDQSDDGEFPIEIEKGSHATDDGSRLFENVAADRAQSHLHASGVIGDA